MRDNRKTVTDSIGFTKQIGSVQWMPSTTRKGTADLKATIEGRAVNIEVKNKYTKDRMSEAQRKEKERIEITGGIYYVATDFVSCVEWLHSNFKVNPKRLELFAIL